VRIGVTGGLLPPTIGMTPGRSMPVRRSCPSTGKAVATLADSLDEAARQDTSWPFNSLSCSVAQPVARRQRMTHVGSTE